MAGDAYRRWREDGAVLTGRGLACRRGERLVFGDLDFSLAGGELLILRGPNGSGKSTLLRLIAGLVPAEQGSLTWRAAPIDDGEAFRAELAYLGHLDATKPELSPREDLRFWLALRGAEHADRAAAAALALLGLERLADLPCRMLSAGQRRRLALARIAAASARIWLLDEPFTALDDASLDAAHELIAGHRAAGGLVMMAAHGRANHMVPSGEIDLGARAAGEARP